MMSRLKNHRTASQTKKNEVPPSTRDKNSVPVDLDTAQEDYENNGVPNTVFMSSHDDYSTIANDTIGRTVQSRDDHLSSEHNVGSSDGGSYQQRHHHPITRNQWNRSTEGNPSYWNSHYDKHDHHPTESDLESLPHSKLPPGLSWGDEENIDGDWVHQTEYWRDDDDYSDGRSIATTTTGFLPGSVNKATPAVSHVNDVASNKEQDSFNGNDDYDEDRRKRRRFLILAVILPAFCTLLVALTVALTGALIFAREGETDYNNGLPNSAQLPPGAFMPFSPTNRPTMASESPIPSPNIVSSLPTIDLLSDTELPTSHPSQAMPTPSPTTSLLPTPRPIAPTPTMMPTSLTTSTPIWSPTEIPTISPTAAPTSTPTAIPTAIPTTSPTDSGWMSLSQIQQEFVDLLQSRASSAEYWNAFENGTVLVDSPQAQAITWLTNDPNYDMFSDDDQRKVQRYALAVLAYSTMMDNLSAYPGWLDYDTHECDWYTTHRSSMPCPNNGDGSLMQRLDLSNVDGGLVGTLPVELGLLSSSLTQLYLSNNAGLSGTLPVIWGPDFQNLQRLQLTSTNLSGTLPPEWGQFSSLVVLGLGRNQLTGTLPVEWSTTANGIGQLRSLETLGLEGNSLTGSIPTEWGYNEGGAGEGLPSLIRLYMNNNGLSGTVPDSLWAGSKRWEEVNVATNALTGTISPMTCTIGTLTTLIANCDDNDPGNVATVICTCCTKCE